jgi:hypothetical protein
VRSSWHIGSWVKQYALSILQQRSEHMPEIPYRCHPPLTAYGIAPTSPSQSNTVRPQAVQGFPDSTAAPPPPPTAPHCAMGHPKRRIISPATGTSHTLPLPSLFHSLSHSLPSPLTLTHSPFDHPPETPPRCTASSSQPSSAPQNNAEISPACSCHCTWPSMD